MSIATLTRTDGMADILRDAAYAKYVAHEFTPDQYTAVLEDIYLMEHGS